MNPNRSESNPPTATAAECGEAVTATYGPAAEEWALISYLTHPLPLDSKLDYVVTSFADSVVDPPVYKWTFTAPQGFVMITESDQGVFSAFANAAGTYETKVDVSSGGTAITSLTLTQQASEAPQQWQDALDAGTVGAGNAASAFAFTLHEICVELHDYIVAAAAATGANGVPALLVATVLYREMSGHPKDFSPGAMSIRKAWKGRDFSPRWDAIKKRWLGEPRDPDAPLFPLDSIRDVELDMIRDFVNDDLMLGRKWMGPKTIGCGQVAQTTAAMVIGETPWVERSTSANQERLDQIESNYRNLAIETKADIFNYLRYPKTNVLIVAKTLATIKNRSHRYPSMTKQALLGDQDALSMIATEYNLGAFDTPTDEMKPNEYGRRVGELVTGAQKVGLEQFFGA